MVLFGDSAYVNTQYMVTPFKGTAGRLEEKDNFNFFHSQLRIQVECTFGMLVHRWGILRKPLSRALGIRKSCALVMALCCLHNFCLNQNVTAPIALAQDTAYAAAICFGVQMQRMEGTTEGHERPEGLLHGGEHFDDVPRHIRQQESRRQEGRSHRNNTRPMLPQEMLLNFVVNQALRRPTPVAWRNVDS